MDVLSFLACHCFLVSSVSFCFPLERPGFFGPVPLELFFGFTVPAYGIQ
jgi:hypothetical protein